LIQYGAARIQSLLSKLEASLRRYAGAHVVCSYVVLLMGEMGHGSDYCLIVAAVPAGKIYW
jgi:hypothetical protein